MAKRKTVAADAGQRVSEILEAAERKAEEIEAEARLHAGSALQDAADALAKLSEQLRGRASGLDAEVMPEPQVPQPEVEPGPVTVPEPAPPAEPEPGPVPVPEPTPDPVPEPTPDPVPEPLPIPPSQPEQPAATNGDEAGARLVAMKMALDGSSREEVEKALADRYQLGDAAKLLDDVFARAGR
jgi:outer membrane biosynthesis protein TonB